MANDGLSTDGSFTTGTLNTGLTQTNSKTTTTSTTTIATITSTSSTSTKFSGPDIKQAALDTVANAVGEVGANKIGDLKADGLDTVTHKNNR